MSHRVINENLDIAEEAKRGEQMTHTYKNPRRGPKDLARKGCTSLILTDGSAVP